MAVSAFLRQWPVSWPACLCALPSRACERLHAFKVLLDFAGPQAGSQPGGQPSPPAPDVVQGDAGTPVSYTAQACLHRVLQGNTPTTSPITSPMGSPSPPPLMPCPAEPAEQGAEPASHAGSALLPVIAAVPDVEPFDMFAEQARPPG